MKELFKVYFTKIVIILSYIFSYNFATKFSLRFNQLYSMWLNKEFKKVGKNFFISAPFYLKGGKHISIGDNFNCGLRLQLEAYEKHLGFQFSPAIFIGDNVSINHDCHICSINEIIIEDGVLIASKVFITDHFHGEITDEAISVPPYKRKLYSKGPVKIMKNVWIGEGVVIMPNVTIGENSIIGANCVVTKSIPNNSIIGGNPFKIIKTL